MIYSWVLWPQARGETLMHILLIRIDDDCGDHTASESYGVLFANTDIQVTIEGIHNLLFLFYGHSTVIKRVEISLTS